MQSRNILQACPEIPWEQEAKDILYVQALFIMDSTPE